jgi:hypothetical protein
MKLRLTPALAVLALAGCSKIHETRPFTMEPLSSNTLSITAPLSEQKIKVAVTADQPVNVWILLEKDIPTGSKDDFDPDKAMKSGVLAKETNTKDATLNATIPAKEKFQIYVRNPGNKSASVTVKVDSQ